MYGHKDWERGIDLSQAYVSFATEGQQQAYAKLSKGQSGLNALLNVAAEAMGAEDKLAPNVRIPTQQTLTFYEFADQLRAQTLNWLQSGQLIGLGYAYPRQPDALPYKVPTELWSANVKWDHSSVEGNGLRIDAVRVVHPAWFEVQETVEPPKRAGRPSKVPLIDEAYTALFAEGLIDFSASQKSLIRQIQGWIKSNRPDEYEDGKGLQDEAVRRTIAPRFDQDKKP